MVQSQCRLRVAGGRSHPECRWTEHAAAGVRRVSVGGTLARVACGAFLRGAAVIELATIFPVIGWLLVFPVATLTALGSVVRITFNRKEKELKEEKEAK